MTESSKPSPTPKGDLPPAYAPLLRARRRSRDPRLLALRWTGIAAMTAAIVLPSPVLAGLSGFAFLYQALVNLGRRSLFKRNLDSMPCLRISSPEGEPDSWPLVTVVTAARNEEAGIEEAARSVAAMDYPNLEIVAVNDHSTDATGAILDRIAAECPRMRVLHDPPLQDGWLGKANAVWHGVHAGNPSASWLLLADADVVFHPAALRLAVAYAEGAKLDFLTGVPFLDNGSLAEEFILPDQWFGIVSSARAGRINEADTHPIGIGAFTLVRRAVYLASGGHSACPDYQPEDAILAATVKSWGGRMGIFRTRDLVRVRLYRGLRELRQIYVRKLRMYNSDRVSGLFSHIGFQLLQGVLPAAIFPACVAMQAAAGSISLSFSFFAVSALAAYVTEAMRVRCGREVARMRRGLEWLHPLACLFRAGLMSIAAAQSLRGATMEWRGRIFTDALARVRR